MTPAPHEQQQLDDLGFVVLENLMGDDLLTALRRRVEELFVEEGAQAGAEFKQEPGARRLANLMNKGEVFQRALQTPQLLACVEAVLGPEYKLSSMNVRSANPHSDAPQPLHCDMGGLPDERGPWVCNSVWLLDDFTPDNGAIRVVPGSHRWGRLPQSELADPKARHPQELLLTAPAGTVVVMNAHLWHGGTGNRTAQPRTALHIFFARRDKPQQQYQKQLVRPEVQAQFSPPLRWLLALDDPHNDAVSREVAVRSGFLK
ncbi:MAG: phytanoyl-CoA dioxygenase family protein [Planctomycetia bacterium]|nr:phytanoyl-CoA dioxygenase family protein [Planctomycetia bacterium]